MPLSVPADSLRWLYRLLLLAVLLNVAVMSLGAYTRLTHAGLGCPDWPGCYGQWVLPAGGYEPLQARFPDQPIEPEKAWIEMSHRYLAAVLGLLIVVAAAAGWFLRHHRSVPWRGLLLAGLLVVVQGGFGRWTVTLKLWPQVVTLHLLGGLLVLAVLIVCTLRLGGRFRAQWPDPPAPALLRRLSQLALAVLMVQLVLGGWTSANYAALACPDFPTCQQQWLPTLDMGAGFNLLQSVGPNYLGGQLQSDARIAIHLGHRIGALVTILTVGGLALVMLRSSVRRRRGLGQTLLLLLVLQASLGIANVVLQLPLPLALMHHGGGVLLWGAMIAVCENLWLGRGYAQ